MSGDVSALRPVVEWEIELLNDIVYEFISKRLTALNGPQKEDEVA